jgi:electron transfer flavoprotein beta subunit
MIPACNRVAALPAARNIKRFHNVRSFLSAAARVAPTADLYNEQLYHKMSLMQAPTEKCGLHQGFKLPKRPGNPDDLPHMSTAYQIVVCGTVVPDPLQTLEPITSPTGPALKNEMMLPAILDPWASHALYEAANLAKNAPGSKVWLVSLGPKAKLQQVMMTVAQKVPFELIALDGPASGFTEAAEVAAVLAEAIQAIPGLDRSKLLLFGGWESASRGAGATMQMVAERLGILDQFQGVDQLKVGADGSLEILERIEAGKHQLSRCAGPPALLGWATGNLPEPKNNPQVGMANMRAVMPALQKAKPTKLAAEGLSFASVSLPKQLRVTKIVKDKSPDDIAREIVEWIKK